MKKITITTALLLLFQVLFSQTVIPFQDEDEFYGLKDDKGNIVLAPEYDLIGDFAEGLAYVMKDDKVGYINKKGEIVIPIQYDLAFSFSDGMAAVNKGGKWVLNSFQGGKWGFIDKTGKLRIPFRYDRVSDFSKGIALVSKEGKPGVLLGYVDGKWGYVNKAGKEITAIKYDDLRNFQNGFAAVNIGYKIKEGNENSDIYGKWGYIDSTGKQITPVIYDGVYDFFNGFAIIEKNGKHGVVNKLGKEVIAPKYDAIAFSTTEPGFARVFTGSKYDTTFEQHVGGDQGYINCNTGKEITTVNYSITWDFNEGLAPVNRGAAWSDEDGYRGGKWGFIDKTGKLVIPLIYDDAGYFFQGASKVELNGRKFSIDKTGKEIKK